MPQPNALAKATALRLIERALELLAANRPLTFREWHEAHTHIQDARDALASDVEDDVAHLSEDERRALFDPASLRRNP